MLTPFLTIIGLVLLLIGVIMYGVEVRTPCTWLGQASGGTNMVLLMAG